jgi:hypothetical protein
MCQYKFPKFKMLGFTCCKCISSTCASCMDTSREARKTGWHSLRMNELHAACAVTCPMEHRIQFDQSLCHMHVFDIEHVDRGCMHQPLYTLAMRSASRAWHSVLILDVFTNNSTYRWGCASAEEHVEILGALKVTGCNEIATCAVKTWVTTWMISSLFLIMRLCGMYVCKCIRMQVFMLLRYATHAIRVHDGINMHHTPPSAHTQSKYIYVYTMIYIYIYIYIYYDIYMYILWYIYIYIYIWVHACKYVYMYVSMYVHT